MATNPVSLGNFLGVNNRLEATRLGVTLPGNVRATWLRAADNVDLDGGFLRRREGFGEALASGRAHSLWGDGEPDGYAVLDGALQRLTLAGAGLDADELLTGFTSAPVSFARMPTGSVVWSDGLRIGAIRDGVAGDLAPAAPNPVPVVNVVAGGLPAGRYLIAFTAFGAGGEGPPTAPRQFDVPEGSGFVFTGLGAGRAYVSGPNGDILTLAAGDTFVSLTNTGPRLDSLLLERMPAGQIVRHYSAQLLVARGSMLCWSEPYRYGLWNPGKSFIQFRAPITVVEPCEAGVFVCADRTYWLAGDLAATTQQAVLPYGGVAGSGHQQRGSDDVLRAFWVSPHGLVVGTPDGSAKAVQEAALKFSGAARAATLYREGRGIDQAIFTRQGIEPLTTASRGFVAADRHRKETVL